MIPSLALQQHLMSLQRQKRDQDLKEQREQEVARKTYQWKKSMMYMNLIVKNVDGGTTEEELRDFFSQFGNVNNVKLVAEA